METISITNRGSIRKFVDDVFIDTIENIYALFDLKISYYGVSIAYKNTGFVTVAYDYLLSISINYKNNFMTATFDENIMNHECIEEIKTLLDTFMEKPYMQEIYTMDKEETPLLYAMGIKNNFKTLKILSSEAVKEDNV